MNIYIIAVILHIILLISVNTGEVYNSRIRAFNTGFDFNLTLTMCVLISALVVHVIIKSKGE